MDQRRTIKVSEAVREELAEIVGFELDDPRLGDVDVTNVQVTPDSRHATVKIDIHGDDKAQNQSLKALEHAAGYLRHELASRLQLRHVPELHFERDTNPGVETRIDFLLR